MQNDNQSPADAEFISKLREATPAERQLLWELIQGEIARMRIEHERITRECGAKP